jgi:hypothetical protein
MRAGEWNEGGHMKARTGLTLASAVLFGLGFIAPSANAASRDTIDFTDHRVGFTGSWVTTDLEQCPTAVATDLRGKFVETRPEHAVFVGLRDFRCADGSGFVVRLTANIGVGPGSLGSWSIVDSYGALEGMRGSGKLVGTFFDSDGDDEPDGIDDHYTGMITLTDQ